MLTINNPNTFDWAGMSLSDCCEGNAMDSYFTLKLFDLISEKMEDQPVLKLLEQVVMPSLETFAEMEWEGLDVALDQLGVVGKQLSDQNINSEDNLYGFDAVNTSDNLSSNNDLIEILYTREEGFGMYPPDRTAKGSPSVSAPTLKLLLTHIDEELQKRG
jgi:DNA polymerase-1